MGCCGDKRRQLARSQRARVSPEPEVPPDESIAPRRNNRTFEFVGRGSLTVRGAVSGTVYRFAHPGARLEVNYADAFAMMAQRDVRPADRS